MASISDILNEEDVYAGTIKIQHFYHLLEHYTEFIYTILKVRNLALNVAVYYFIPIRHTHILNLWRDYLYEFCNLLHLPRSLRNNFHHTKFLRKGVVTINIHSRQALYHT